MIITPQDVRDYSTFASVQGRTDTQLEMDILQASQDIFDYCGHEFTDPDKYPDGQVPAAVKLAFIKVTEYYALLNTEEAFSKGIVSEKIGNYSYQLGEGGMRTAFNLRTLLRGHVLPTGTGGFRLGAF